MSRREARKVTEARKEIFLHVLGETGSRTAAAAAASPHTDGGTGQRPGYERFRDLWKRDPEFALAVEQAEAKALGRVEGEIVTEYFGMTVTDDSTPFATAEDGFLSGHRLWFFGNLYLGGLIGTISVGQR